MILYYVNPINETKQLEKLFKYFDLPRFEDTNDVFEFFQFDERIPYTFTLDDFLKNIDLNEIIEFAYEKCKFYIPEKMKIYFIRANRRNVFERDIKEHVKFITTMKLVYSHTQIRKIQYNSFSEFITTITKEFEGANSIITTSDFDFYRERFKSYAKIDNSIESYLNNYRLTPLKYQQYYLFYMLKNLERYPHYKKTVNIEYENIKEFVNKAIQFVDSSNEEYKNISNYIIERSYNQGLIMEIIDTIENKRERNEFLQDNKSKFVKSLALLSLLPDVKNATKYINAFLHKETYALNQNEYGWGSGINNFTTFPQIDPVSWNEDILLDIIEYALVFMPLLEAYTLYIVDCINQRDNNAGNSSFHESVINNKSSFLDYYKASKQISTGHSNDFKEQFEGVFKIITKMKKLNIDLMNELIKEDLEEKPKDGYKENIRKAYEDFNSIM